MQWIPKFVGWCAPVGALFTALVLLAVWLVGGAGESAHAGPGITVAIDADPGVAGTNPTCGPISLAAVDGCIEVESTETNGKPGPVFDIEVVFDGLPNGENVAGWNYILGLGGIQGGPPAGLTAHNHNLFIACAGGAAFDFGEPAPDYDGTHIVAVFDSGLAEANPPYTGGVLDRSTLNVTGLAPGQYSLTLSSLAINNTAAADLTIDLVLEAIVAVDVLCVPNDAPVADDKTPSTNEDTPVTITLTGSDADAADCELTFSITDPPDNGGLGSFTDVDCVSGAPNTDSATVQYTPGSNYNGSDSFTYRVYDGIEYSNTATVDITITAVNDAPVAADKAESTAEDTPVTVTLTATDVETCNLTFTITDPPDNGGLGSITDVACVSGSPNTDSATVQYTPNAGYTGGDPFTYKANDGTDDSDPATVDITVVANQPPTCSNVSDTTDEDTQGSTAPDCTDPEGDPLSYEIVDQPSHGSASVGSLLYNPALNYNGLDSFTYKANDGELDSDPATVEITVNAVNDAPVAANDAYSTDEDTTLNVAAPGVLTNDSDVDGDTLSAILVSDVSHGTLTLNANGSFSYDPDGDWHGTDSFSYKANDGTADSNIATVSITVNAVNDAPVADDVSGGNVPEGSTNNPWTPSVSDPDGDSLSCSILTPPTSGGSATVAPNCSSGTYTPPAGFTGPDSFTYQVSDGSLTDDGTVTFNVVPEGVIQVTIDIKPGSWPNSINLRCHGVIPVAILTTGGFDAATVDPATVTFADASPKHSALEDVDDDGDVDLILHFKCQQVNIDPEATEACLQASTYDGQQVEGCDSVRLVPPHSPADSDADGFTDAIEICVGTDLSDDCPDDLTDDAWPPDMNNDTQLAIADVILGFYGKILNPQQYDPRADFNVDGALTIADVIIGYYGKIGTFCS